MNCINCGTVLKDGDKFCPKCGTPVVRETNVQSESVSPVTPEQDVVENKPLKEKKKKKKAPIIIAIILAAAFLLGGCGTAFYFIDPMGLFTKQEVSKPLEKEEEAFEITDEMLNGYWIAELDPNLCFEKELEEEFEGVDVEQIGDFSKIHMLLFFEDGSVMTYYITEDLLRFYSETYEISLDSICNSETYLEEQGLTEEEVRKQFSAEEWYGGFDEEFTEEYRLKGIICRQLDNKCNFETEGSNLTLNSDKDVFEYEYTEDGELALLNMELDEDTEYGDLYPENTVFTKVEDFKELEEKYEKVNNSYIDEWLSKRLPQKDETESGDGYTFGTIYGQNYANGYLGISCSLSDEWILATEEEVATLNGLDFSSLDEDISNAMLSGQFVFDMFALHENETDSILITVEAVNLSQAGMSVEEYLGNSTDGLEDSELYKDYDDMTYEKGTYIIDTREYATIKIKAVSGNETFFQTFLAVDCGECVALITITSYDSDRGEEVLKQFYIE